jgi:iron(III) transport system substrate-binding protein
MNPRHKPTPSWPEWARPFRHVRAFLLPGLAGLLSLVLLAGCRPDRSPSVIVYAAQDQVYAEPILAQFTKETGIKVRALYDSEAVKTVGLANRLLAERKNPRCDLFWGNEELRTRHLAAQGVFVESNGWAVFGFRSRRIVVNTNKVASLNATTTLSLLELTNAAWRGKIALAYPLFGTTCTHFLALRQAWGPDRWSQWCRALQANQPLLVDGNSQVVKLVGRGEASIGLTDSDDVAAGQREQWPVVALPMTRETLLIPNTVALVRSGPHPAQAQELYRYLQQRSVGDQLMMAQALECLIAGPRPRLKVDWAAMLQDLEPATAELKAIFMR